MSQGNMMRTWNQMEQVGNPNPPDLSKTPDSLLNAAVPGLANIVKTNTNLSERAANDCRSYSGIDGLRRLQAKQANRSFYEAGCGWVYKPSNGINPEINQGILGTAEGPTVDKIPGGGKYYWDLDKAEKEITQQICSNARRCSQLKYLGQFTEICGFCKSTGSIIPIEKTATGYKARYRDDCQAGNIVTASGACPIEEGFLETTNSGEGFVGNMSFDDLDKCNKSPLTRDCVILSARMSGCSDQGSLIQSLQGSTAGDYDSVLKTKAAFQGYQTTANPSLTNAVLKDGSSSLDTALGDFSRLMEFTGKPENRKRYLAARDLCIKSGEYDNYNFCAELTPESRINANNIVCIQNEWLQQGGTKEGSRFPTLQMWQNQRKTDFNNYLNKLLTFTKSTNKNDNAKAIKELIGMDSYKPTKLPPRNDMTRGAETVWIDLRDASTNGVIPIILKCDMKLAKDGEVLPYFTNKQEMTRKYQVNGDNIALTSAFELRPEVATKVQFSVTSDDGFMLSVNQNPFEKTNYSINDWGSWKYQAPTNYVSGGLHQLFDENNKERNIIVTKWFQGGGLGYYTFYYRYNQQTPWLDQANNMNARKDIYLTQEPLAPWMQYEICEKPNMFWGKQRGFFERRWNGQAAYAYGNGQPIWSFDIDARSVGFTGNSLTFPGKGAWWHTKSYFAFTAFKTITLLVKPNATLAENQIASIFHHVNFTNLFGTGLYLTRYNGQYFIRHWFGGTQQDIPVAVNDYNLVVLQYVGDSFGIRNITCHVSPFNMVKTDSGRRTLLEQMKSRQNATGSIIYGSAVSNRDFAGYLVLGGTSPNYKDASGRNSWQTESFQGEVKWIHGFRNYIDTDELLKTEIEQTWIKAW
jgi:hypothetical protein